jgi:hypothetical protein
MDFYVAVATCYENRHLPPARIVDTARAFRLAPGGHVAIATLSRNDRSLRIPLK